MCAERMQLDPSTCMNGSVNHNDSVISDREENQENDMTLNANPESGDAYFSSYTDLSVHELMLKDKPRTLAYKNFILSNKHLFQDRVVLDVGAGTGILSLFCAKAGARKVYAVEASGMSHYCEEIVKHNHLDSTIFVIKDKVENIELEEGKVDIIVSEWMGFYLLHESMLDSILYARDKFLSESGVILPSSASLFLCPVNMEDYVKEHFEFWKDVYDFDFSPLIQPAISSALQQPTITVIKNEQCLSDPGKVVDFDLKTISLDDITSISQKLSFYIEKDGTLHGFVSWFDVYFCAPSWQENGGPSDIITSLKFSTSPACEATHWKQTVMFLPASLSVEEGDVIHCGIELSQDQTNKRHYNISIEMLEAITEDDESESSDEDLEEGDMPDHPVPCDCERGRCKIIRAIMEKYDEEQIEIEEEAEFVEMNAEKEAARAIDMEGL